MTPRHLARRGFIRGWSTFGPNTQQRVRDDLTANVRADVFRWQQGVLD